MQLFTWLLFIYLSSSYWQLSFMPGSNIFPSFFEQQNVVSDLERNYMEMLHNSYNYGPHQHRRFKPFQVQIPHGSGAASIST
jgi:hypothetical protein